MNWKVLARLNFRNRLIDGIAKTSKRSIHGRQHTHVSFELCYVSGWRIFMLTCNTKRL